MLSALSLEKKKDVNQLSIPHHLIANTYFYPCLGQQFFKKNTHLLLQVLDFVCQSISYKIYQQRGLPKCSHAGRVSPRDSHTCPSPWPAWQLLECLIGNFRSLSSQYKSHPSNKVLKGEHGLAVDFIQIWAGSKHKVRPLASNAEWITRSFSWQNSHGGRLTISSGMPSSSLHSVDEAFLCGRRKRRWISRVRGTNCSLSQEFWDIPSYTVFPWP